MSEGAGRGGHSACPSCRSKSETEKLKVASDIGRYTVLFTVRKAVKLPLMWKLWSHKDVNKPSAAL